jgi:hypothetical protein
LVTSLRLLRFILCLRRWPARLAPIVCFLDILRLSKLTQEYSGKVYGGAGLQQPTIREPFGTRTCRDGTSILISRRAHAYTRCYPIAV